MTCARPVLRRFEAPEPAARGIEPLARRRLGYSVPANLFLSNLAVILLTTGTGIVTARLLGPEGRGQQAAMIMWPQLLAGMFAAGIPAALLYNLRQSGADTAALVATACCGALAVGTVAGLAGIPLVAHMLCEYPAEMVTLGLLALLLTPLEAIATVLQHASQGAGSYAVYNLVRILVPALILGLLLLLPRLGPVSPSTTALVYIGAGLPVLVLHLAQVWRQFRPRLRDARRAFAQLYAYSRRAAAVDLVGALSLQLDRGLLVALVEPGAVGLYAVAASAVMPLNAVRNAIVAVVFPRASGMASDEAAALGILTAKLNLLITGIGACGLAALAPWMVRLLYGSGFAGSVPVVRLLAAEAVFSGTSIVLSQVFMATARPGSAALAQTGWVVVLPPLMAIGVRNFGLEGAALAVLMATVVRTGIVVMSLGREIGRARLWITRAELHMLFR